MLGALTYTVNSSTARDFMTPPHVLLLHFTSISIRAGHMRRHEPELFSQSQRRFRNYLTVPKNNYSLTTMRANGERDNAEVADHATSREDHQEDFELIDPDPSTQILSSDDDAAPSGAIDGNLKSHLPSTAENPAGRLTTYLGDLREQMKASGTLSEPQIRKVLKSLAKSVSSARTVVSSQLVGLLTDQKSGFDHSFQYAPYKGVNEPSRYAQRTSLQSHSTLPERSSNPLLGLPAELRNRIYRFALIKPKSIDIDKIKWPTHQPALLKTCKQIRREALGLFYFENRFCARIDDWDPVVKDRFSRLMVTYNTKSPQLSHCFKGDPSWPNLLKWLRAVYERRVGGISDCIGKERTLERKLIGILFMTARKTRLTMPWSEVVTLLEAHREVLGQINDKWLL